MGSVRLWYWGMTFALLMAAGPLCADEHCDIQIDVAGAPQCQPLAEQMQRIALDWYPRLCRELASEGFTPPRDIKFVFTDKYKGIAATAGATIYFGPEWFRKNPDDHGVVVHEMVHVIQAYPPGNPGWVVEGIADYIRWRLYEPQNFKPRIDPQRSKHTDSYQTTAAFFGWIEEQHPGTMKKLNAACRAGRYDDGLFTQWCGRDIAELWEEFIETRHHQIERGQEPQ